MELTIQNNYDAPIWKLEVEYERFLRYNHKRGTYLRGSDALFDLFSYYPKKTQPEEYLTPDIEDWARERMTRYSLSSVRRDIAHVHAFFKWLWFKGIEMQNPAVVVRVNGKEIVGRLRC